MFSNFNLIISISLVITTYVENHIYLMKLTTANIFNTYQSHSSIHSSTLKSMDYTTLAVNYYFFKFIFFLRQREREGHAQQGLHA